LLGSLGGLALPLPKLPSVVLGEREGCQVVHICVLGCMGR
jgi:hypothetical protein